MILFHNLILCYTEQEDIIVFIPTDLWSEAGQPTSTGSGGGTNDCVYYFRPYNSLRDCLCIPLRADAFSLCEGNYI